MAELQTVIAGIEDEGQRLDAFMATLPPICSRNAALRMIESGQVRVSGKLQAKNYRLKLGDEVVFAVPKVSAPEIEPQDLRINYVYEDDDIIVVDKPSGLVVHPSPGHYSGTLINGVLFRSSLAKIGAPMRPGVVHRLDKDTSGLLVLAKTDNAYFSLVEQLSKRLVRRLYLALVHGGFEETRGRIDAPIGRSEKDRKIMAVALISGKEAITDFTVVSSSNGYSLLEVSLRTGRTHQIRVHMKFINHPIVGDRVYGSAGSGRKISLDRQWLHAYKLEFTHPKSNRTMSFKSDPPLELKKVLARVGVEWE